jgi:multiple sugar transport system ATP-binding protein
LELYNDPNNKFVGQFIGTPSMNIIRGSIENASGQTASVRLNGEGSSLEITSPDGISDLTEVDIGFRPESITVGKERAENGLSGEISLLEPLGDRTLVNIDMLNENIEAYVSPDQSLSEGDEVSLSIPPEHIYLFNVDSGERIAQSEY